MSLPQLKVVCLSSDGGDCQLQHNQALFVIKGCSIWVVGIVIFRLIEGDHPQFLLVGLLHQWFLITLTWEQKAATSIEMKRFYWLICRPRSTHHSCFLFSTIITCFLTFLYLYRDSKVSTCPRTGSFFLFFYGSQNSLGARWFEWWSVLLPLPQQHLSLRIGVISLNYLILHNYLVINILSVLQASILGMTKSFISPDVAKK